MSVEYKAYNQALVKTLELLESKPIVTDSHFEPEYSRAMPL